MSKNKNQLIIQKPILILVGPTAIGKTSLSLRIAETFNCEIISVDSMQVYRYMDIGTAKATIEERRRIPHHLIDIVNPDEEYNAARFVEDALAAISEIHHKDKIPLLTGGTGLYIRALKNGLAPELNSDNKIRLRLKERVAKEGIVGLYEELQLKDPRTAEKLHPHDTSRIIRAVEVLIATGMPLSHHLEQQAKSQTARTFDKLLSIGLSCERFKLYQRINERSLKMIEYGLEKELRELLERGYSPTLKPMQAIGYRHMLNYIRGKWSKHEMIEILARDTRRYAKRQFTWFLKEPSLAWYEPAQEKEIIESIKVWLSE